MMRNVFCARWLWCCVSMLLFTPCSGFSLSAGDEGTLDGTEEFGRTGVTPKFTTVHKQTGKNLPEILGVSFEYSSDKKRIEYDRNGSPKVLENMEIRIRLYGHFTNDTYFKFSKFHKCDDPSNRQQEVKVNVDDSLTVGVVDVRTPKLGELHDVFMCLKTSQMASYMRQGDVEADGHFRKPWLVIKLYQQMLPLWLHLVLLTLLLALSGLFSGLNLGLMSLNKTDLKVIKNTGTSSERSYASAIAPVRNHGNFLLCCLLFSNVLVNASLTILVDDLTSGLVAVIMSTLAIVIFGEIIPQAICSRHGLAVGAKTIFITKFFMFLTFPLSYPLSKILDKILGEEIGSVYTRDRLKELLKVTKDYNGLENEEVGIISGALDLKSKLVGDIMVRLENVFMLPIDAVLDFETMAEVEYHGYTRIPVYEGKRSNVVAVLNVKQLTLLDANDNIPLATVVKYYENTLFYVFEHTRLDYMFRAFKEGSRGHMAFVQRINDEGPGDPFYETVGLVTMEDVLEELLQAEIMDESDKARLKSKALPSKKRSTLPMELMKRKPRNVDIPPQLALAAVQFLSTTVEAFDKERISVAILRRLVANCCQFIKLPKHRDNQNLPELYLYEAGKPAEYFVMVLEGRVAVTVGKEKLTYESGAFTTFGKDFLLNELAIERSGTTSPTGEKPEKGKRKTFIPDYTVRVATDLHYLLIKYSAYKSATVATGIEKAIADPAKTESVTWRDEVDKMLIGVGEDDPSLDILRKLKLSRDDSYTIQLDNRNENDDKANRKRSIENDEKFTNKRSCKVIDDTEVNNEVNEVTKLI